MIQKVLFEQESKLELAISELSDSHLEQLPTSILDIYRVFEHIDMLFMGMQYHPYTVLPPYLVQILGFCVTC
jgi:hypothetical protein